MASKENQKLIHKLCNEILTTIQFNTNRDVISGLQQAIDRQETIEKELELYKRAFELSCKDHAFCDIDLHNCEDYMKKYINKAKEELENGRK